MSDVVVVVGTGTEVGKTHVSEAVLRSLRGSGRACVGLKPVESGVSTSERTDWQRLGQAAGRHVAPLFAFDEAVSPHLTARDAGVTIELGQLVEWVEGSLEREGVTLVETAGGLMSPLSSSVTNLDLCVDLRPRRVLLVAVNRLGALHDVAVCMRALSSVGWPTSKTVLALSEPAESVGRASETNAEELRRLNVVSRLVRFPREGAATAGSLAAASALVGMLDEAAAGRQR